MCTDFCLMRSERQEVSVQRTKAEGSMGWRAPRPAFQPWGSGVLAPSRLRTSLPRRAHWVLPVRRAHALTCGSRTFSVRGSGILHTLGQRCGLFSVFSPRV